MAAAASVYPPLHQRPVKNTVLLFDVDDTLTKPRQVSHCRFFQSLEIARTEKTCCVHCSQATVSRNPCYLGTMYNILNTALMSSIACQARDAATAL